MHSVSVATTARSAAQFVSADQSCWTPLKAPEQPHERLQRLDGSHPLIDLDPQDVLDQGLECIDRAQADLLPEEALRRARLLKAVQQLPVQLVRLFEGRLRPGLRPRRVRRPDAQRVHERVDAPRDDVAVVPARHRDVEVPLWDIIRAEYGAVLSENVSSERKPER